MVIVKESKISNEIKSVIETIKTIADPSMRLALLEALIATFGGIIPKEILNIIEQAKLDAINSYLKISESGKNQDASIAPLSRPEIVGIFEGLALNILGGIKAISSEKAKKIAASHSDFMSDITEMGLLNITNLIDKIHSEEKAPKEKDIKEVHSKLKEISADSYIMSSASELEDLIRSAKRDIVEDSKQGSKLKFSELPDKAKSDIEKVSKLSEKAENLLATKRKLSVLQELSGFRSELGEDDEMSFASKFFKKSKGSSIDNLSSYNKTGGKEFSRK